MQFRYFSDTSELSRNPNESASVSPISQHMDAATEVDAANNNKNVDLLIPRIQCPSSNPCKHELMPCLSLSGRRCHYHDGTNPTAPIDSKLDDWLILKNIDKTSREIILNEQFSYKDFMFYMEKADFHRIGLK